MADAKIVGKEALLAKFPRITPEVIAAVAPALEDEAEAMTQAFRRAAPVLERPSPERTPGELRASIQKYPNGSRPLSWRIIAGAVDKAARRWSRYVEFGHAGFDYKTKDGATKHFPPAPPHPFWWPTYRSRKKPLKARAYAAARRAIKKLFPAEG